jgi:hypothetical protein
MEKWLIPLPTQMSYYNPDNIKPILESLGYKLIDKGSEWRSRPLYRDSDNETVLSIKKETGKWTDFARGIGGKIEDLIEVTLRKPKGFGSQWLLKKGYDSISISQYEAREQTPITYPKYFDPALLQKLEPEYKYWINRGISANTLKTFGGGNCKTGKMAGRYVFPIFDDLKRISGFAGRSIFNNDIKWKLIGKKSDWKYPLFLTKQFIEIEKTCFLVESIGDGLKLWESGVKNFIICFGINSLDHIYYELVKLDPDKIFISFNDDSKTGSGAGNFAAKKAAKDLLTFFHKDQISIKLPTRNDFGDMTPEEIIKWKKTI